MYLVCFLTCEKLKEGNQLYLEVYIWLRPMKG